MSSAPDRAGALLAAQIDLRPPVAAWVLGAHLFTLSTPVVLLAVAWDRHAALEATMARPGLVMIAAALLLAGSAFEIAQNTEDRWYYVGPAPALADLCFTLSITAGLAVLAVAASAAWWTAPAAVLAVVLAAGLYATGRPGFPAMGMAGTAAVVALYLALDNPVVVLVLVTNGFLNGILLDLVMRTRFQAFHGGIALANGLGTLVIAAALRGDTLSWTATSAVAAVTVVVTLAALPVLRARPASPRS